MTDHGDFSYDPATRILRGILLPFGERSRTSVSGAEPIEFGADNIDLPRDASVVGLNRHHNRHDPVGRATFLEKRAEGVYSEFRIADTDEGDAYIRDNLDAFGKPKPGALRKLSAEVTDMVRDGARAVRARLTGAALVTEGAFASAALFAADDTVTVHGYDMPAESESSSSWSQTNSDGTGEESTTSTTEEAEDLGDGKKRITRTTTTVTTITEEPEADEKAEGEDTDKEEALMGNIVPGDGITITPSPTLDGMFAALARNNPDDLAPYAGAGDLFAIANIQHSGPSGATIGQDTQQTGYLGELWDKLPYQQRFIPLVTQETLTNYAMQGWRWVEGKSPEVGDYAGNVTDVPSNTVDTEPVTVNASRLAGGHALDRRFTDFNDQAVVASYVTHQADDYKRKADAKCLAAIMSAATATAPGSVPAGIAKGLAAIVDGALDVIGSENRPAYSLVSPELWRDIVLTPKDDVLAFLNAGFGLEEGDMAGFKIMPAPVGAGKVIVGAKEAVTFWQLGGEAPIRVDGVRPGQGATEIAVFGYYASLANNAKAVRSVTVAA
ncbi:hypothetical protein [Microbacterium sp. H6]|uniref:phage major capsid protein n=1 Tax=Microbacterium sp. H6 TaxID=421122 RepID=UPI000DE1B2D8|nr:hypothetical protein [Microbacterium sp. H6]RBO72772.1 hypothetical protein DSP71_09045 [Microbacterium sp. H6]